MYPRGRGSANGLPDGATSALHFPCARIRPLLTLPEAPTPLVRARVRRIGLDPESGEYVVHVVFKAAGSFSVYTDVQPADWRAAARRIEIGEGTGVRGDLKRFRFRLDG
jgi:hypothetical protein